MLTGTVNTAGLPQMDAREKAQIATGTMHQSVSGINIKKKKKRLKRD